MTKVSSKLEFVLALILFIKPLIDQRSLGTLEVFRIKAPLSARPAEPFNAIVSSISDGLWLAEIGWPRPYEAVENKNRTIINNWDEVLETARGKRRGKAAGETKRVTK